MDGRPSRSRPVVRVGEVGIMRIHVPGEQQPRCASALIEPPEDRTIERFCVLVRRACEHVPVRGTQTLDALTHELHQEQLGARIVRPQHELGLEIRVLVEALLEIEVWGDVEVGGEPRGRVAEGLERFGKSRDVIWKRVALRHHAVARRKPPGEDRSEARSCPARVRKSAVKADRVLGEAIEIRSGSFTVAIGRQAVRA